MSYKGAEVSYGGGKVWEVRGATAVVRGHRLRGTRADVHWLGEAHYGAPGGAEVRGCNLTQWHEPRKFLMLRANSAQADRCNPEQQDGRAESADRKKEDSQVPPLQLTQGLGWAHSPCTAGEDGCTHWGVGYTTSTHTLWEDPDCTASHGIPTQVWRNKNHTRSWADDAEDEKNEVELDVLPTPPPSPTPSAPVCRLL